MIERDGWSASPYVPDMETIRAVALEADLRNPHHSARDWLVAKIDRPANDWDERTVLTVPGIVWTVGSDTCATGRLSAPDNVAYDTLYREFVFRQPRDAAELGAVMSADSEEVFACYRFDGLDRWTARSVAAWYEDCHVLVGFALHALDQTRDDPELQRCIGEYAAHLESDDFARYIRALISHLELAGRGGTATVRRA